MMPSSAGAAIEMEDVGVPTSLWEDVAADAVGGLVQFWGFKHNHGRVWALLFLRGRAMTAAEIRSALSLSKGAVSMVTRSLEGLGMVHRERAHTGPARFRAEPDILRMIAKVLSNRELSLVREVRDKLARAEMEARSAAAPREVEARLRRMRELAEVAERALDVFLRTARLDATPLRGVLLRASSQRRS